MTQARSTVRAGRGAGHPGHGVPGPQAQRPVVRPTKLVTGRASAPGTGKPDPLRLNGLRQGPAERWTGPTLRVWRLRVGVSPGGRRRRGRAGGVPSSNPSLQNRQPAV
jgi:hypothetical protein